METNIDGYPNYYVSKDGRVYSFKSKQWLKYRKKKSGYIQVYLSVDGKQKEVLVHRLVALAYLPNLSNLPCVMHMDDDKTNNHVGNLRWGTYQDNMDDKVFKGRQAKGEHHGMYGRTGERCPMYGRTGAKNPMYGATGEKNPNAKLSNVQRAEIQYKYKTGAYSHRKLALEYGIGNTQIGRIINNSK